MGNNQPRSFKFYRKNEEEVMRSLGLKHTKRGILNGWSKRNENKK